VDWPFHINPLLRTSGWRVGPHGPEGPNVAEEPEALAATPSRAYPITTAGLGSGLADPRKLG
jgi:hypothetical protein